jgi:prepilin-type N-terminal cleavage/methylation domain-containing protein
MALHTVQVQPARQHRNAYVKLFSMTSTDGIATKKQIGFTIVELLIVIVIIGILAAITIVAFNGVQERARASSVSSALSQASKKLSLYAVDNSGYPADLGTVGVTDTDTVKYQYEYNNSVNPATYCITATNGTTSYKVSSANTTPSAGGCAGHGQGGVAAITNIVPNPRGQSAASGWFRPLTGADMTVASNISWNSRTDWNRLAFNGTGNSTARLRLPLSSLTNGSTYTTSVLLGNNSASSVTTTLDFCDLSHTTVTLAPNEVRRVTFSATRATYDSVYSFVDLSAPTGGVLATEAMVTLGTTTYNYGDGGTTNWVWNGTPHSATSTGPAP